jgi:formyltetrahydrofolate deformylase
MARLYAIGSGGVTSFSRNSELLTGALYGRAMENPELVLLLSCPDRRGIVADVSRFLYEHNCNILDSQQFGDRNQGQFFMRKHFISEGGLDRTQLEQAFKPLAEKFAMRPFFFDSRVKTRAVIMVSKFGHALVDLLYRCRIGALSLEVPLIVSNHRDFEDVAQAHGVPFVYLPVKADNKQAAEEELTALLAEHRVELIVLARYMQILSNEFCRARLGQIINIHHSFLPSFKGANPYTQAHVRGVKLIGATAHYVTGDLDEGPIIEQAVERVSHALNPEDYVGVGRDIENTVLARAVKWHCEHRILLSGRRTVIFP